MNKKRLYIIVAITLAVLALIIVITMINKPRASDFNTDVVNSYQPEFMNQQEKEAFGLSADSQIQVLTRGETGEVQVYKIIREEGDVVTNPAEVK